MAMKRWVIAGAGVLAWMAAVSSAGAADIPAPVVKAPIAVPAKQSWYGFYIGANGGYAWGNNSVEFGPEARHEFLPDGRLDSAVNRATWSLDKSVLQLRWPDRNAPDGAWIDTCHVGPDGASYVGRNQNGLVIRGRR